ncbi:MAG: DUF4405 domain-containing protein [bacterium]|nr:DUF4405 domain-containing protein [bacterium]
MQKARRAVVFCMLLFGAATYITGFLLFFSPHGRAVQAARHCLMYVHLACALAFLGAVCLHIYLNRHALYA